MASMTLEDLSSQLKKIDFCMLSTNAGSGRISARPMSNNGDVEYDGDSWFFSYEDSRKITEIEGIDTVLLTFTAPPACSASRGFSSLSRASRRWYGTRRHSKNIGSPISSGGFLKEWTLLGSFLSRFQRPPSGIGMVRKTARSPCLAQRVKPVA